MNATPMKPPLPGYLSVWAQIRSRDFNRRERDYSEGIWLATLVNGIRSAWLTAAEVRILTKVGINHQAEIEAVLTSNLVLSIEDERKDRGKLFRLLHPNLWKIKILPAEQLLGGTLRAIALANGLQQDRTPFDEEFSEAMADAVAMEGRMPADHWLQQLKAAANGNASALPILGNTPRNGERNPCDTPQNGELAQAPVNTGSNGSPPPLFGPQLPEMGSEHVRTLNVNVLNKERTTFKEPTPQNGELFRPKEILARFNRLPPKASNEEKIHALIGQRQWDRYDRQWREQIQFDQANVEKAIRMVKAGLDDGIPPKKSMGQWLWFEYKIASGRIQFGVGKE